MNQLSQFKVALEDACSIIAWNPTALQLQQIAKQLLKDSAIANSDLNGIISSVCPNATFLVTEGIDNSDLRTLIAMAIQVANAKG